MWLAEQKAAAVLQSSINGLYFVYDQITREINTL